MYGMLEEKEYWRAQGFVVGALVSVSLLFFKKTRPLGLWLNFLGMPLLALGIIYNPGAEGVSWDTDTYGGLFLTLFVAYFGILWALPVGTLLALGRRSGPPVIKIFCVLWIEVWRGVPLITVLFMSSVMVPYFLPEGVELSKLTRAMVGIVCFSGAYMAEVIRGGLQGVQSGQGEVSRALGLTWLQSMRFVVLPQALQMVSPAILNNFISLFKDTTLVAIIGMFDFLGAVQAATKNSAWLGYSTEGYVFAAILFWFFCYGISKLSRRLNPAGHLT
jgi:general L-amino acid transport system permease protein